MPVKEFEVELSNAGDVLRLRIATEHGEVRGFTVQYEATVDDERVPVVRYDTAHGRPHRDVLDRRGETIRKDWLPESLGNKGALEEANQDLRTNWGQYRKAFLRGTR